MPKKAPSRTAVIVTHIEECLWIIRETRDKIKKARKIHNNPNIPFPVIQFFKHANHAGESVPPIWTESKQWEIWYSLECALIYTEEMISNIVPHEVSHLVTDFLHFGNAEEVHGRQGHTKNWKDLTQQLGGTGETYHTFSVVTPANKKVVPTKKNGLSPELADMINDPNY